MSGATPLLPLCAFMARTGTPLHLPSLVYDGVPRPWSTLPCSVKLLEGSKCLMETDAGTSRTISSSDQEHYETGNVPVNVIMSHVRETIVAVTKALSVTYSECVF